LTYHGTTRGALNVNFESGMSTTVDDSTTTVDDAACSPSTLSREDGSTTLYDCVTDVTSEVSLHWTIDSSVVHVAISKTSDSGYLALGVPDSSGTMVTSDAFIAFNGTVETYRLTAYSSDGVSQSSISVGYSEASVTVSDGATTLRIVDMELADLTSVDLIWAHHADSLTYHGTTRGALNVNFESGVAAVIDVDTVQKSVVEAHAIMAITAWGWLAPFAVTVKAIGTGIGRFNKIQIFGFPVAFLAHVFLMLVAMCLTVAAVALAKAEFPQGTNRIENNHDTMAYITFSLVIAQVVAGLILRPNNWLKPDHQYFGRSRALFGVCHRTAGLVTMVIGLGTVMRGAETYKNLYDEEEGMRYRGVAFVGFVIWCAVYVLFEVCWYLYYYLLNPTARAGLDDAKTTNVTPATIGS